MAVLQEQSGQIQNKSEKSMMKGQTGPRPQCRIAVQQEQSRQIQNKSEKSKVKWPKYGEILKVAICTRYGPKNHLFCDTNGMKQKQSPQPYVKETIAHPHSWETIVFLPLDDFLSFTHFKLQRWI